MVYAAACHCPCHKSCLVAVTRMCMGGKVCNYVVGKQQLYGHHANHMILWRSCDHTWTCSDSVISHDLGLVVISSGRRRVAMWFRYAQRRDWLSNTSVVHAVTVPSTSNQQRHDCVTTLACTTALHATRGTWPSSQQGCYVTGTLPLERCHTHRHWISN